MLWLDKWTKEEIAKELDIDSRGELSRYDLEKYQLIKLNQALLNIQHNSSFYQKKLLGVEVMDGDFAKAGVQPIQLASLADISKLPFTTMEELERNNYDFFCVRPDGESKIISVTEKGEYGSEKRTVFTDSDKQRTVRFFQSALSHLVRRGDKVLILFPCRRPDIQGDIVRQAVEKIGASTVPYGPLSEDVIDWGIYLELLNLEEITCIIGTPSQVANLAEVALGRKDDRRYTEIIEKIQSRIRTVVLGMDYVKPNKIESITKAWNCSINEFFGKSEIGFACTFSCPDGEGYHLREADVYVEVIDPITLMPTKPGESGELVVTTLTREGMPLIRLRTGNRTSFIDKPCSCGSVLKKIERVQKRV